MLHFSHHFGIEVSSKVRELRELYISMAMRYLALSMIGVFVPIYLINTGYSIREVLFYYLVLYITHVVLTIPAAKIAAHIGLKHGMIISIPFLLIFYGLLYSMEFYTWPLPLLAIIYGINTSIFWFSYHTDFIISSQKGKRGSEVSTVQLLLTIVTVIGPVVGGLILSFMGFHILFALVAVLLSISVIPLFMSPDIHEPVSITLRYIFNKKNIFDLIAFAGRGLEGALGLVWPIVIFFNILNGDFTSLGSVTSLSLLISMGLIYLIGKLSDKNSRLILRIGSIVNAIVWMLRTTIGTPLQVFLVDSLYGVSQTMVSIPFKAMCYDKASGDNNSRAVSAVILRELAINSGSIVLIIILLSIADLASSLLIGSGASLLYLFF